jgi:NAD-dependent dihydropyrimidine dehydrogenase PreA subunit
MKLPEKYAYWKGIPREEIDWAPRIDENKCAGCGMCVTSCGREVFSFDEAKNKAVVARPLQCMVGCTSCKVWCVFNAISFPDEQYIKNLIIEKKVLTLAKNQLKKFIEEEKKKEKIGD